MKAHECCYNPPFMVLYLKKDNEALEKKPKPHDFGDYNKILKIPFMFELVQMYEQINGTTPLNEPILFLDRKCKLELVQN